MARPGSVCVSAKVYEEVRRKLSGISFIDGGAQKLKNIEDPITIYHIGDGAAGEGPAAAPSATTDRPLVAVQSIRVISGDDEVKALAEGLTDAIDGALARNTAIHLNPSYARLRRPGVCGHERTLNDAIRGSILTEPRWAMPG